MPTPPSQDVDIGDDRPIPAYREGSVPFDVFLDKLRHPRAAEVVKSLQQFSAAFKAKAEAPPTLPSPGPRSAEKGQNVYKIRTMCFMQPREALRFEFSAEHGWTFFLDGRRRSCAFALVALLFSSARIRFERLCVFQPRLVSGQQHKNRMKERT